MNVKSIDLAWISVTDMKKAREFFVDTLGLSVGCDTPEYGWIELKGSAGGAQLGIGAVNEEKPLVPAGSNAIVTFTVDDLDAALAELRAKNVTIIGDIIEIPGHVRMIFIQDNDSNTFQLAQVLDQK